MALRSFSIWCGPCVWWRAVVLRAIAAMGCLVLVSCGSSDPEPIRQATAAGGEPSTFEGSTLEVDESTTSSIADAARNTASPTTTSTTTTIPEFAEVVLAAPGVNSGEPNVVTDIASAVDILAPGGTIVLGPGTQPSLQCVGIIGDPSRPLQIVGADGAVLRGESHSSDAALLISESAYIDIRNILAEHALWGIMIESSEGIAIANNVVRDVGQEAVRVRDGSSQIRIINNTISDTGQRSDIAEPNGEGVYIGTGTPSGVDVVTDIEIVGNDIFRIADEAIDIKVAVSDVLIADNRISDVATATSGAVVIHLNASADSSDPNIVVERNIIRNVTRTSPYRDGNCIVAATTVTIVNNVIHGCEHRGIYLRGEGGVATIQHNTLIETGTDGAIVDEILSSTVVSQNNLGAGGEENHALVHLSDLVDPTVGDYRLQATAQVPKIAPSVGVLEDFTGELRPSELVTFGAFEYTNSVTQ